MDVSRSFKDLFVWQKAHEFVLDAYKITLSFPKEELYGLTSQFRRAAISCPANISEGYTKKGKADKLRFLNISQASLEECRYYLILSKDLNYISIENFNLMEGKAEEGSKLLNSYMRKISESI